MAEVALYLAVLQQGIKDGDIAWVMSNKVSEGSFLWYCQSLQLTLSDVGRIRKYALSVFALQALENQREEDSEGFECVVRR